MPEPTVTVSAGEFSESQKASQRGCAPGLSSHNACNVIQQREFLNCWKTKQSTIPLDGSNSGLKAKHSACPAIRVWTAGRPINIVFHNPCLKHS